MSDPTGCAGFPDETYDRYVLGLLERDERALIDREIEQNCPLCVKAVQRSMNLWLVFAGTLEQTEPSADFRARLVRIAELSNRILTVPKNQKRLREPGILISSLVILCLILLTLLLFSWIAGRQSADQEQQRAAHNINLVLQDSIKYRVLYEQEQEKNRELNEKNVDKNLIASVQRYKEQLSKAQAEAQQYKDIMDRDSQTKSDSDELVNALRSPGARLLTLRNKEESANPAYAFVIENSKLIFFASHMTAPSDQHQYQLWLVSKEEPRFVSAKIFSPEENKPVMITYTDDKHAIASLAGLLVTEEPLDGSPTPSGPRVLETSGVAPILNAVAAAAPAAPQN